MSEKDAFVERRRQGVLERHVQTIVVAVTLGMLGWVGTVLIDMRDRLTRFEEKLLSVQAQVQSSADDRFRGADWRREREIIEDRFRRNENRIDKLEGRR